MKKIDAREDSQSIPAKVWRGRETQNDVNGSIQQLKWKIRGSYVLEMGTLCSRAERARQKNIESAIAARSLKDHICADS